MRRLNAGIRYQKFTLVADKDSSTSSRPSVGYPEKRNPIIVIAIEFLGDKQAATADYNQAIVINPQLAEAWDARVLAKYQLANRYGACEDMRTSTSLGLTWTPETGPG